MSICTVGIEFGGRRRGLRLDRSRRGLLTSCGSKKGLKGLTLSRPLSGSAASLS